jgi:hypothetical protein
VRRSTGAALLAIASLLTLALPASAPARAPTGSYQGAGAWIDIFDGALLADPYATVTALSLNGVRTIYVETANYANPRSGSIANPVGVAGLIDAAHASGIEVVAWYLPGLRNMQRDLRRSLAAIRFTTLAGGTFDSFALDIESNRVRRIGARNRRVLQLSRRIRTAVGPEYPLGAIVPDQRSTASSLPSLWPRFPYRRLSDVYDVFLPMSYSSARGKGAQFVYLYTRANVEYLRAATHDLGLPVHVVGGLANRLRPSEDTAVVQAALDEGTLGASFYDRRISDAGEWAALLDAFTP